MVKIGEKYELQKCRHRYNNGLIVKIIEIKGSDDFIAENISTNDLIDETGFKYSVGLKNLGAI